MRCVSVNTDHASELCSSAHVVVVVLVHADVATDADAGADAGADADAQYTRQQHFCSVLIHLGRSLVMAIALRVHEVVLLRLTLHSAEEGRSALQRADVGEVCEVRDTDGTVKVRFGKPDVFVRCKPDWLERYPGTICKGINAVMMSGDGERPHSFYHNGMMVSDLCFPTEKHACFSRLKRNRSCLLQSGLGFSFYDSMDASSSRWLLCNFYKWKPHQVDERIGLVLCEEIWPWNRAQWPKVADFHQSIASALMSQWTNATCVMVLRSFNAEQLQRALPHVKRISYHYGSKLNLHYVPLCMNHADPPAPVVGQQWCAVVIHPAKLDRRLVAADGDVYIPELVLKAMFSNKCTLQLCAYTGESALGIMKYLQDMKELHGVRD